MKLETIRKRISAVDARIVELIRKKQDISLLIGEYKKIHNIPVHQPKREKEMLKKLEILSSIQKINPRLISRIFKLIFTESKKVQKMIKKG